MKRDRTNPGAQLRHFKSLCLSAQKLVPAAVQNPSLIHRLRKLEAELRRRLQYLIRHYSGRSLRRILAAASLALGVGTSQLAAQSAPNFAAPVKDPFNLSIISAYSFPELADLDGDSDLDLLVGVYGGVVRYFENVGTAMLPDFTASVDTPFGMQALGSAYVFPLITHGDIDGDGDFDLLSGDVAYGNFYYYENTGNATTPAFGAPTQNPFGLTQINYSSIPAFADIDGDGDLDVLATDYDGNLEYFENTGTTTQPAFAAPVRNPFGWSWPQNNYILIKAADMDMDGDIDVLGSAYGDWAYYENTGTTTAANFAPLQTNPFNLMSAPRYIAGALGDLDGDGDIDVMGAEPDSSFTYYENMPLVSVDAQLSRVEDLRLFPNPARDRVRFRLPEAGAGKLHMYDLQGREVYQTSWSDLRADAREIAVGALATGMYEVVIDTDAGRYRGRFMKE